jgi:hypothetical protein
MSGVLCDAMDVLENGFASLTALYVRMVTEVGSRFNQLTQLVLELNTVQLTSIRSHDEVNIAKSGVPAAWSPSGDLAEIRSTSWLLATAGGPREHYSRTGSRRTVSLVI